MSASTFVALAPLWRRYICENREKRVWLYMIQAGVEGPIKIGIAIRPAERLATLQQANAEVLRPLACWRAFPFEEKGWHEEFARHRIRGEWFRPDSEVLELARMEGDDFGGWDKT